MRLYHGSSVRVPAPALQPVSGTKDFGPGFYTTTSEEQAGRFARLKARRLRQPVAYVSEYEQDETTLGGLDVLRFDGTSHEWVEFVKRNRMEVAYEHGHDLVIGPVADDKVFKAMTQFLEGDFGEAVLIEKLLTFRLHDQWLFHTERSLERLLFRQALEVSTNKTSSDE